MNGHSKTCVSGHGDHEWSGSRLSDDKWVCDECGGVIDAESFADFKRRIADAAGMHLPDMTIGGVMKHKDSQ